MKHLSLFVLITSCLLCFSCSEQKLPYEDTPKEVLLIGARHIVYDPENDVYGPVYQLVRDYAPETIFVEYPIPDDDKTWKSICKFDLWKYLCKFKSTSDSLRKIYPFDELVLNRLIGKNYQNLTDSELDTIITSFTFLRDFANAELYSYFKDKGTERMVTYPYQDENRNLSYPLAISLRLNKIYGIDDQRDASEYAAASARVVQEIDTTDEHIATLFKRAVSLPGDVWNANSLDAIEIKHKIASGRCVQPPTSASKRMIKYWDTRNERIVRNFISSFNAEPVTKGVIIIGSSHLLGVKEEIEKQADNITVKLISDLSE